MAIDRRRRIVAAALAGGIEWRWSHAASATLPKVGYLSIGTPGPALWGPSVFLAGLRDVGLVDGQHIEVVWRYANGDTQRLPALAADLLAQNVSVIVAPGNDVLKAAAEITKAVPIVTCVGLNLVGLGFVRSYRRPGTNVTGTVWEQDFGVTSKYLELLTEAIPGMGRVGCLIDASWPGITPYRDVFDRTAAARRIAVDSVDIRTEQDIDRAVPALAGRGSQAVFVYGSQLTFASSRRIVDLTVRHALPDIWVHPDPVQAGALMSYGASFQALYRRAGYYVDRILRGANPAELPIEMPTQYELWINRERAKSMGLVLPASLLARADRVIE